jgi:hypothetical protein
MTLAFSRQPVMADAWVRSEISQCEICDEQSGNGTFFFFEYFSFPLSVSFFQYSMHIFMYMLRVLDGQMGDAWEPSKKQCCFGNRGALDRKVLSQNLNAGVRRVSKYLGAN